MRWNATECFVIYTADRNKTRPVKSQFIIAFFSSKLQLNLTSKVRRLLGRRKALNNVNTHEVFISSLIDLFLRISGLFGLLHKNTDMLLCTNRCLIWNGSKREWLRNVKRALHYEQTA